LWATATRMLVGSPMMQASGLAGAAAICDSNPRTPRQPTSSSYHGSFDAAPAQDTADVFDQGQVRFRTARVEANQTFEDVERGGERWLGHMAILERQRSPGTP
jgi:hypothetical protein